MDSKTSSEAILADYINWISTFSREELLKETIRLAEKQLLNWNEE